MVDYCVTLHYQNGSSFDKPQKYQDAIIGKKYMAEYSPLVMVENVEPYQILNI